MARTKPAADNLTKPTSKPRRKKDPTKRFLAALAEGVSVTGAAKRAGISRQYAYELRDKDPVFAKEWDDALEAATDRLEEAAFKRAEDSSDQMMSFLLRARRPDKYRDKRTLEHTGLNGGPVVLDDISNLTEAQRTARVAALLDAARERSARQAVDGGQKVAPASGSADAGVPKPS